MEATKESYNEKDISVDEDVISVIEENLVIDTVKRVTGEISVTKNVVSENLDIPAPVVETTYVETRKPIGEPVDAMPETRTEGDTLIIPVVREETVVTKRLVLVEEIHLTRKTVKSEKTFPVVLRTEEVTINRL